MQLHLLDCGGGGGPRQLCGAAWRAVAGLRFALSLVMATLLTGGVSDAARCFCDKRNCADALMCDGEWCLVGFKSDVRLDQMCASGEEAAALRDCKQSWQGWVEVCACRDDFCNTFNYLRTQMERLRGAGPHGGGPDDVFDGPGKMGPLTSQMHDASTGTLPIYQGNQLIILLVVVPLGVGAAAVCLVFLNYHCKMC